MRSLVAIVAGLAVGIAAALGLAVAVYSIAPAFPAPTIPPTPTPAAVIATPAPTPTLPPTPAPTPSATPSPAPSRSPSPFPLVGKAAPALVAPRLDGTSLDLARYRGKPVWVVFTGTYCPPCRDEYPLMNGFAARYADAGLAVLAIHAKDDAGAVADLVKELSITFPVALDADGSRAAAWDAIALPVHYWIDAGGTVQEAALGGLGPDQMAANLGTILPGVTIGE
jgi:thiol-disulfide isomerase/thioredoxin